MLPWLSSCGSSAIQFNYPAEAVDLSSAGFQMPDVYLGAMRDLRPADQRSGQGHFVGITYPADEAWEMPVTSLYRDALAQDLNQTHLVALVPLQGQADYTFEADILSFKCRLKRSPISFLLPIAVGMGVGLAVGEDQSDRIKVGVAASVVGLLAIPLPSKHRAEAEVRMRVLDSGGDVVWEKSCLGEVDDNVNLTITARNDQKYVDRFLTKALKKCNACLIGQFRQEILLAGG
jgi:hypothetical protein